MTSTTTIRSATVVAALAAALALGACGSSSGGDDGTATTASAAARTAADGRPSAADRERLAACLREQGVELPQRPAGAPAEGAPGGPPPGDGAPAPGDGATAPADGASPPGGRPGRALSEEDRKKMESAFEACGGRPGGGFGSGPGRAGGPSAAALKRFVACVRRNGYDLPDPDTSGRGPAFDADRVDRNDPVFVKASRACQQLLAAG